MVFKTTGRGFEPRRDRSGGGILVDAPASSTGVLGRESSNLSQSTERIEMEACSKTCSRCKTTRSIEAFALRNKDTGRRNSICRVCHKEYVKRHYTEHKQKYIDRARRYTPRNRRRNVRWLQEYKESRPCTDCGGRFHHAAMDFDHVHGDKINEVSRLSQNAASMKKILAEISKCELVCANCHRVRTFKRIHGE